jgi:hypothetical protein
MFTISRAGQAVACAVVLAVGLNVTPLAGAAAPARAADARPRPTVPASMLRGAARPWR